MTGLIIKRLWYDLFVYMVFACDIIFFRCQFMFNSGFSLDSTCERSGDDDARSHDQPGERGAVSAGERYVVCALHDLLCHKRPVEKNDRSNQISWRVSIIIMSTYKSFGRL